MADDGDLGTWLPRELAVLRLVMVNCDLGHRDGGRGGIFK